MKKVAKKVPARKETEIESLARVVVAGFGRMDKRFEQVDKRFEQMDEKLNERLGLVDSQLASINHTLNNHSERLDRIERNQTLTRTNLDETIHRSEFTPLVKRVTILEKKGTKK